MPTAMSTAARFATALSMTGLLLALLLAGCSLSPHRVVVPQGNIVTPEMVARLEPGMSRQQVRATLGTPLLADIFHENRWDYVYRRQRGSEVLEQARLTVFFEDDRLARVQGTVEAADSAETPDDGPRELNPPRQEPGFLQRTLDGLGF